MPFFRQGYGQLDATAAVELGSALAANSEELKSLTCPAGAEIDKLLQERQAVRDAEILETLPSVLHTKIHTPTAALALL